MNRCPCCATQLDGGPVVYRCGTCQRAVYAADLNTEYQPCTALVVSAPR